jgi:hypothetical protein
VTAPTLLGAALDYGARSWPVLPCRPRGKTPLLEHGLHDASTDADQIRAWWARWPGANIGLRTGVAFDALDVDGPEGETALDAALPGPEAPTVDGPTVATGHGWHVYVAPTGLGNRAGVLPSVDWRGAGGYVIAPPSIHPSGARYRWELPDDPAYGAAAPLRPAPGWLLALLDPPRPAVAALPGPSATAEGYGRRALEGELGRLAVSAVGQRNHELHRAAVRLGQLVAARAVDAGEVVDSLLAVGARIGLDARECEATVRSGMAFGIEHPR